MYTAWCDNGILLVLDNFFFVSNIFKFKFLVAHFVLLLAPLFLWRTMLKMTFQHWASEIVNPLITIATILQHCVKSQKKLHHFISYRGTGECSPCHWASSLIDQSVQVLLAHVVFKRKPSVRNTLQESVFQSPGLFSPTWSKWKLPFCY